jgi:hypothetical protein
MSAIKARKPTGRVPWPLVLIEGAEKTGKSYTAAQFTASQRIGQAYWLDLGEGSADEYGAIPGANYLVLEHDGTWPVIMGQVLAVRDEAARAQSAGEKPVVLVIDSMTAEWDMHKDWISSRARKSNAARRQLERDPNAEIKPAMNLWNDANERHHKLIAELMTFPGIVLMTARGKEVAELGEDGKPIPNAKSYKVEGHKNLAFDATAWVRLSRDNHPEVVGVRSLHAGLRPGVDKAKRVPDLSIEWLVFDYMKCDPTGAQARRMADLVADELAGLAEKVAAVSGGEALWALWQTLSPEAQEQAKPLFAERKAAIEAAQKPPTHEQAVASAQQQLGGQVVQEAAA